MSENQQRGEISCKLGDVEYILTPTFDAVARIEARTGKGLVKLAARYAVRGPASEISLAETASIVELAIGGTGKSPKNVGELVMKAGLQNIQIVVLAYLVATLVGDKETDASGEAAAAQEAA